MRRRVLVFPGQGLQKVGMFDRYIKYDWAIDMINEVSDVVGYDMKELG
jgi:hypothetical protein